MERKKTGRGMKVRGEEEGEVEEGRKKGRSVEESSKKDEQEPRDGFPQSPGRKREGGQRRKRIRDSKKNRKRKRKRKKF